MCGADFRPEAVVATLFTEPDLPAVCEPCLRHLAVRAKVEGVAADWDRVYADYPLAVARYPEPVFPTLEALLEAEAQDPHSNRIYEMAKV